MGIQLTHGGYESLKVPEAIEFNQVKEEREVSEHQGIDGSNLSE